MNKRFTYTGVDNLEVMAGAKNYNSYLVNLVKWANSSRKEKTTKVLDFGAGSGTYAEIVRGEGYDVECIEPDAHLQSVLKKKKFKVQNDAKDATAKRYDSIYSFNVFEHIDDDYRVAETLLKSLKPGGSVVIYVPAFQILFSSMDTKVGHFRRYRKDRLQKIASDNNLVVKKLAYCDPVGYFAALTFRFVGNKNGDISPKAIWFYDRFVFPLSSFVEPLTSNFFGKNVVLIAEKKRK